MATRNEDTEIRIQFIVKDLTLNNCLSDHETVPAVGIRLLNFPSVLVYLPPTQEDQNGARNGGTTFRFNRGKSCLLQANPESLAARLEASSKPVQVSVLNMSASPSPSLVGTGKLLCDPQLLNSLRQRKMSGDQCSFEGKYLISLFDRAEKNIAVVSLKLRVTHSAISQTTGGNNSAPNKELCSPMTAAVTTACSLDNDRKDPEQCYRESDAESCLAAPSCEPRIREEYLPNSWLPSPLVYKGTKMSCLIQSDCKEISRAHKMPDQPTSWVETQTHWTTLVKADLNSQPLQTPPPPLTTTESPAPPITQANSVLSQLPVLSAMLSELSLLKTIDTRGPLSVQPVTATTGVQTDLHQTSSLPAAHPTLPTRQEEPRTPCKVEKKASRRFMRDCCDVSYLTSTSLNSSVRSYKGRMQQRPGRRANKHRSKSTADDKTSYRHHQSAKPAYSPSSVGQLNDSSTTHSQSSQVVPWSTHSPHQEQALSLPLEHVSVNYSDSLEVTPIAQPTDYNEPVPHTASQRSSSSRCSQHQPLSPPPTASSSSSSVKPAVPLSLSRADSLDSTAAVLPQISQKLYLASSQSIDMAGPVDSSDSISFSSISSVSVVNKQTVLPISSTTAGSDGEGYSDSFESDLDSASSSSSSHYTSCAS